MSSTTSPSFDDPRLFERLAECTDKALDELPFGVIGFGTDPDAEVLQYNSTEGKWTGLSPDQALGLPLFEAVAQCMNNYLVAQRFADAVTDGTPLDATLDYVFTWRVRPSPVTLRLLARPGSSVRYVVIRRQS